MITGLKGKTALVTGAGRRIGRATALDLAKQGVNIIVHYRSSERAARDTVREIEAHGVKAWPVQCDFSDPSNIPAFFKQARAMAGDVDILINSASIFPEQNLSASSLDDFSESFTINAFAPFVLCRETASQNIPAQIVNILDTRMNDYDCQHVPYHLSKRTLFDFTRMMSVEFAPLIRVNAVAPGLILPPEGKDEKYLAALAHTNPLQKIGDVANVVDAIVFLLKNDFITGQVVFVDGGRHLKGSFYGT